MVTFTPMFTKSITACSLRQSALGSIPNEFLDYQSLLVTGMANENSVWSLMGDCFGRLWSSTIYPMKFPITSRVLGPGFCLGAIILQMAWFFCIPNKIYPLGGFWVHCQFAACPQEGLAGKWGRQWWDCYWGNDLVWSEPTCESLHWGLLWPHCG